MIFGLEAAETIIAIARETARDRNLKPLTICVVDAGGYTICLVREDGTSPMRPKIAHGKAFGAIQMGLGSRTLYERAQSQPYFIQAMNSLADGSLVPVPGGVLVRHDGQIIGAVGITGASSDDDEACAIAGIKAAGFVPDCG